LHIKNDISVIITTYNSSSYISNSINSVLQQVNVNIEIIIVDDLSNDFKLLKQVVSTFSKNIYISVIQPNKKGNANISRNLGVANAQYGFIAFLDADDTWNPEHLSSCTQKIKEESLDACFSRIELIGNKTRIKSMPIYKTQSDICEFIFSQGGISVTSSLVIRKSTLTKVQFNEKLFKHQDWDFLIRYTSIFTLGQSSYFGLNYTLSTGNNMSSKFNFDASIYFMNKTLEAQWHSIFLASQTTKLLSERNYLEAENLRDKFFKSYSGKKNELSLFNKMVLYSTKRKLFFLAIANSFIFYRSIKKSLKLLKLIIFNVTLR